LVSNYRDPKSISNQPTLTFGQKGSNNGQFDGLAGICLNSKGEIIVADDRNNRIQIFDKNGKFLHKFGSKGNLNGQFDHPYGITVNQADNIYIY